MSEESEREKEKGRRK